LREVKKVSTIEWEILNLPKVDYPPTHYPYDRFGLSALTTVTSSVAPPISMVNIERHALAHGNNDVGDTEVLSLRLHLHFVIAGAIARPENALRTAVAVARGIRGNIPNGDGSILHNRTLGVSNRALK